MNTTQFWAGLLTGCCIGLLTAAIFLRQWAMESARKEIRNEFASAIEIVQGRLPGSLINDVEQVRNEARRNAAKRQQD